MTPLPLAESAVTEEKPPLSEVFRLASKTGGTDGRKPLETSLISSSGAEIDGLFDYILDKHEPKRIRTARAKELLSLLSEGENCFKVSSCLTNEQVLQLIKVKIEHLRKTRRVFSPPEKTEKTPAVKEPKPVPWSAPKKRCKTCQPAYSLRTSRGTIHI